MTTIKCSSKTYSSIYITYNTSSKIMIMTANNQTINNDTDSNTIRLCIFDAGTKLKIPSSSSWNSLLRSVPEETERNKISQYKPPPGISLHEHYNPKSFLMGRHLLRGMIVKYSSSYVAGLSHSSSSIASSSAAPDENNTRCNCCDRPILSIPRTFEGRPCVAVVEDKKGESSAIYNDSLPSINLSHNNGVVAVGILPQMMKSFDGSEKKSSSLSSSSSVIGVDVMCIDTVPTSLHAGLRTEFTNEKLEELLDLLEPYMTKKEWKWINNDQKRVMNEGEKIFEFAKKSFFGPFESRRRRMMKMTMKPPDDNEKDNNDNNENDDSSIFEDTKLVQNLYRLWRFLILWTIKEAVLKAAGIGLGFDTTAIEIEIIGDKLYDIDEPQFYSSVVPSRDDDETTDKKNNGINNDRRDHYSHHSPLDHIKISINVPDGVKPNRRGGFGPSFFKTWLIFDQGSVSVSAVVLAPAFVSKWSGHEQFVLRSEARKKLSSMKTDEEEDAFWEAIVREEERKIMEREKKEGGVSSSVKLKVCEFVSVDDTISHAMIKENDENGKMEKRCCGCCFAKLIR